MEAKARKVEGMGGSREGGRWMCGVGAVTDNRDPEGLGRVRVAPCGASGEGAWLPVLRRSAGRGSGMWALPEAGTQAVYALTDAERGEGLVLGFIYDGKRRPPTHSAGRPADSAVFQGRKHRVEIIDEKDGEEIRVESAKGKMRVIISKEKGIKVINELGDVNIKCRNLTASGEEVGIRAKAKRVTAEAEGGVAVKAGDNVTIECEKGVRLRGKNIRLLGSGGVTSEGKQIAAQGDKVMGFDTHIMVVPAGTGTATVPLPHPFMGKINEKVSGDVKLGSRGVAVKGSKARHDDSTHMQLPGTIKFQNNPKRDGEVTGGTSGKVKADGKEVAVIGSKVTTCNDVGMRDNSMIMAAGMSIPMPSIINPLNTEEFRREREERGKKEPQFQKARWARESVKEGEEVELTATVRDVADGNVVTLQVFPEGSGPGEGHPYARFPLAVKGGSVSAKWKWASDAREMPPDSDPRFVFTAHSAWCDFEKSSNTLTVELKRPKITKAEWRDAEGRATDSGLVGEPLRMRAEARDFEEGQGVTLTVRDAATGEEAAVLGAEVRDGVAEAEWKPIDIRQDDEERELKYIFEVSANRCKKEKSGECQIRNPRVVCMEWDKKAVYYGDKATLKIETFELSDEKPVCKLQLWEKDYTTADDFILEKDITIDSDEVEVEFVFDFDVEKVLDEENDNLEFFCRLLFKGKDLAAKIDSFIFIRTTGARR